MTSLPRAVGLNRLRLISVAAHGQFARLGYAVVPPHAAQQPQPGSPADVIEMEVDPWAS